MLALFAERGGDPDRPGKKDPLDWLLWRGARPDEPSWETAIGPGRPGWHIECTAIVLEYLEPDIDVQGGGSDLAFPHHEMCAAQATVVTGVPFARSFVQAGMVAYDGEKMSKSRGNLVFVSKLRAAGVDPMAIRLALLAHHYRDDWEYTDADLTAAVERLRVWRCGRGAFERRRTPRRCSKRCACGSKTTSTRRARWPPSMRGRLMIAAVGRRIDWWRRLDASHRRCVARHRALAVV